MIHLHFLMRLVRNLALNIVWPKKAALGYTGVPELWSRDFDWTWFCTRLSFFVLQVIYLQSHWGFTTLQLNSYASLFGISETCTTIHLILYTILDRGCIMIYFICTLAIVHVDELISVFGPIAFTFALPDSLRLLDLPRLLHCLHVVTIM